MAVNSVKTTRTDPLRNFKFTVKFVPLDDELRNMTTGIGDLGFAQMGGLSVQNELIAYREGGMNTHPHKMIGQSDFFFVNIQFFNVINQLLLQTVFIIVYFI